MPPKSLLALAFMILLPHSQTRAATDTTLEIGKAHNGTLNAGKAESCALLLKSEDVAEANVVTHGTKLLITVYDPSGREIRRFRFTGPGRNISFRGEDAGQYLLQVGIDGDAKDGLYTITLVNIITLSTVSAPAPNKYDSPRIKSLHTALENKQKNAVGIFWDEVKAAGAPLIEPLQGDDRNMLVTFLWKGTASTRSVMVLWRPFAFRWPEDYRMSQLGATDVWYKTLKIEKQKRFMYSLGPNAPLLLSSQEPPNTDTLSVIGAISQTDPLNPKHWLVDPADPDLPQYRGMSVVEMPDAPAQPWLAQREGVPVGTVERHQFESALLKNTREIAVYLPPNYSGDSKPYDLLILFDEQQYLNDDIIPTHVILDNLISQNRIHSTVAVLIDNPPDARMRELPCNAKFADFLSAELLPWAHSSYNITLDPRRTVVAGASAGGLAAACVGFYHPENFGNILSQSGSFQWTPPKSDDPYDFDPAIEPDWVAKQFTASPKLPLRFYMEAGSDEVDLTGRGGDILLPNRNLRDVLLAKGYEVHYHEFSGGHDFLSWRGDLADGLMLLMDPNLDHPEPTSVH